jgi:hypothetical protein
MAVVRRNKEAALVLNVYKIPRGIYYFVYSLTYSSPVLRLASHSISPLKH